MAIKKDLLAIKPKVDEPEEKNTGKEIDELKQRIEALEKQIDVLAGFEKTLFKAIDDEIDLLVEASGITTNQNQKSIFKNVASSLGRVRDRWMDGDKFIINKEKMLIDRIDE